MRLARQAAGALLLSLFALLIGLRAGWVAHHWKALAPVGGGDLAPAFRLPTLDGHEFVLGPGGSGEVTVIDFWATWCAPCRAELPHIDALHRRYQGRGVRVVALDTEELEVRPEVERLAHSLGLTLPIALGGDEVSGLYKVTSLPTLALVARDGTIAKILIGVHDTDEIARQVDRLLAR